LFRTKHKHTRTRARARTHTHTHPQVSRVRVCVNGYGNLYWMYSLYRGISHARKVPLIHVWGECSCVPSHSLPLSLSPSLSPTTISLMRTRLVCCRHAPTHADTHTHAHARTRTHTHAHARTRTHARTQKEFGAHRRWMMRNYSVALAIIFGRSSQKFSTLNPKP